MCGMSVVGGDWESLKRYNLSELYHPVQKPAVEPKSETTQQGEMKDEGSKEPKRMVATDIVEAK